MCSLNSKILTPWIKIERQSRTPIRIPDITPPNWCSIVYHEMLHISSALFVVRKWGIFYARLNIISKVLLIPQLHHFDIPKWVFPDNRPQIPSMKIISHVGMYMGIVSQPSKNIHQVLFLVFVEDYDPVRNFLLKLLSHTILSPNGASSWGQNGIW